VGELTWSWGGMPQRPSTANWTCEMGDQTVVGIFTSTNPQHSDSSGATAAVTGAATSFEAPLREGGQTADGMWTTRERP
jgi:hypothetical protein